MPLSSRQHMTIAPIAAGVAGGAVLLSGPEGGLVIDSMDPAFPLRERPGGGAQAKRDRDPLQAASLGFTVDETPAAHILFAGGKSGASFRMVYGPEGSAANSPRWTVDAVAEIVHNMPADGFRTFAVTLHQTSLVAVDTY